MPTERQFGMLWGAVAAVVLALAPLAPRMAGALGACPIRSWFDVPCLTCGATRAALALARFDFVSALGFNPLVAVGFAGLVAGGLVAGLLAVVDRSLPIPELRAGPKLRLALVAVLIANWAYLIAADI